MAKIDVKQNALVKEVSRSREDNKYQVLTVVTPRIFIRYIGFENKPSINGQTVKVGQVVYKGTEITG